MTRHKHAQTGLVTPSPLDRWIDATLRMLAMLVLNVASTLQMTCRRGSVIGTQAMPTALPQAKTDTQQQEIYAAQQSSPIALILRDREAIVSKDEGVLTIVSHDHIWKRTFKSAFPAKAGIQSSSEKCAQRAQNPVAAFLASRLRGRCVLKHLARPTLT